MRIICVLVLLQSLGWYAFLLPLLSDSKQKMGKKVQSYRFFSAINPMPIHLSPERSSSISASAIVQLYLFQGDDSSHYYLSTGFVFTQQQGYAYLLSTAHFCELATNLQQPNVHLVSSALEIEKEAAIIYWDSARDLCLLKTDRFGPSLQLAPPGSRPDVGSNLGVMKPFHLLQQSQILLYDAIAPERIRSTSKLRHFSRPLMGIAMNVMKGQSGSPLIDQQGRVIGVIFGAAGDELGVAVHVDEVYDFIADFNLRLSS